MARGFVRQRGGLRGTPPHGAPQMNTLLVKNICVDNFGDLIPRLYYNDLPYGCQWVAANRQPIVSGPPLRLCIKHRANGSEGYTLSRRAGGWRSAPAISGLAVLRRSVSMRLVSDAGRRNWAANEYGHPSSAIDDAGSQCRTSPPRSTGRGRTTLTSAASQLAGRQPGVPDLRWRRAPPAPSRWCP